MLFFFIIIYVPIIILFFFCFSSFTSDESIIAFIIVTFFKLLSIVIFLIFCGYKTFWLLFLICLISDGITIPLQFLLFPKILKSGWLGILVISGVIDIYITAISGYFLKKGEEPDKEKFILIVDYGFFIIGYAIAVGAAAIAIGIVALIIYLIVMCINNK